LRRRERFPSCSHPFNLVPTPADPIHTTNLVPTPAAAIATTNLVPTPADPIHTTNLVPTPTTAMLPDFPQADGFAAGPGEKN